MPYLSVFGHTNVDILVHTEGSVMRDASVQVRASRRQFGGVAANVARSAARLGLETALVSYVGEDFPADYRAALVKDGVDMSRFVHVAGAQSPTCWVITDKEHDQRSMIQAGPMSDFASYDPPQDLVRSSKRVHMTTGKPGYYVKLARLCKRLKVPYAFDPSQGIYFDHDAETYMSIAKGADMLFMNEFELARVLEFSGGKRVEDLLELARAIVVTLGKEGSRVVTRDGSTDIPAVPPRRVVDPTGAGDSFRAGFYLGMSKGWDLAHCARMGSTVASFVVEEPGPQDGLPTAEQASARYGENFGG